MAPRKQPTPAPAKGKKPDPPPKPPVKVQTPTRKKLSDLGENCSESERSDIQHGLTMLADKYEKIGKQAEELGDGNMRRQCTSRVSTIAVLRGRFGDQRTLGIGGTPIGDALDKDKKGAKSKTSKKNDVHPAPKPPQKKGAAKKVANRDG